MLSAMPAETPPQRSGLGALLQRLVEHRRGLARLLLVAGALVVAEQLLPLWPRTAELELDLGARHGEVRELRLSYLQGGEELGGVSLRYAGGAPSRVHHSVSLPSGEVELLCELRGPGGATTTHSHALRMPVEGVLRVSAEPSWGAAP
jgi:hypothetical protein